MEGGAPPATSGCTVWLSCCAHRPKRDISMRARTRGREGDLREVAGLTDTAGNLLGRPQRLRTSARECAGLGALREESEEGKWR